MKTLQFIFIFIGLFWALLSEARTWEKIEIPGAFCGNGEPYSVFLDHKDTDKLLIEFMGGGACWSEGTCYGSSPLTQLTPLQMAEATVMNDDSKAGNPWNQHTAIFMPYCTGDVHAGFHIAFYKPAVALYHSGYTNTVLTFAYLKQKNLVNFPALTDVTLWGYSGGAIGAFLHTDTLNPYLSANTRKTLIADSPGLHFGKTFWQKFPQQLNHDYAESFARIGLVYSLDDGFLAPLMGPVFLKLNDWNIGILQSTQDMVMSIIFGNISPQEHRRLVLGPQGIAAIAKNYANVKTWIADTITHTFLVRSQTAVYKDMLGETAWDFAVRVHGDTNKKPMP